MEELRRNLRHTLRRLAKNPGFTATIVLTLGLGIGANAGIFSLMDQVLLRALPVRDPGRLVVISAPGPHSGRTSSHSDNIIPVSHPMFLDLALKNTVFDGLLGFFTVGLHVGSGRDTDRASGEIVTGTYFQTLGLTPALGRLFGPEDDRVPGGHPVVVVSNAYWKRRFGADPGIVGRTIHVNGSPMSVVGIAPAGFMGSEVGRSADLFVPTAMKAVLTPGWDGLASRRDRWLHLIARLKPGLSIQTARPALDVLYRQLLEEDFKVVFATSTKPEDFRKEFLAKKLVLFAGARGMSSLRTVFSTPLLVLMGMVGLVLLIACANVANLLLARSAARQREIAVRLAVGAGRGRLIGQLLTESAVLGVLGALTGLAFAALTTGLLLGALPQSGTPALSAAIDVRVASFALALGLLTTLFFGLAPALQITRPSLAMALRAGAGGRSAVTSARLRQGLVIAQVALSLLLLIGAGLFVRSLKNLLSLDPGFAKEQVLTFDIDPALNGYTREKTLELHRRVQQEIAALPGVTAVSMAEIGVLSGNDSSSTVRVAGYTPADREDMSPNVNQLGPGFFKTLGMRLVEGREFTEADSVTQPLVGVVNETFARYFFKGESAVGKRFGWGRVKKKDAYEIEIVGVVADGKNQSLRETPKRFVYTPLMQAEIPGRATYYVKSAISLDALAKTVRRLVGDIDSAIPVTDMKPFTDQVAESLFVERVVAGLSAGFGLLATLLAAIGLYGVTSWAVTQRTQEIGIRMALGAEKPAVLWLVLKDVGRLALIGITIGLPTALVLGRLVKSQLFGITSTDPLTFVTATVALATVTLLAGFVPARRAMRVEPVIALRYE